MAQEAQDAGGARGGGAGVGDLEDGQAAHRVGALAVTDRLDVGVGVRVDRRGDGDTACEVGARLTGGLAVAPVVGLGADQGLGVGAGQLAEPVGEVREQAVRLHAVQQGLGAVGAGGDDDAAGGEGAAGALLLPVGGERGHREAAPGVLGDRHDGGHGVHDRAGLLGEVEVVLVEGVLRAAPAAGHALAALVAGRAVGARAAEVRVGYALTRLGLRRAVGVLAVAEEDADGCHVEGVADPHPLGGGLQVHVGRGHGRVEADAQHALGLVVVGRQLVLPVGDVPPLGVLEEGLGRYVEGVGVVEGAAADARACQDHDIPEQMDALDAEHAELRRPQVVLQVPGVLGQGLAGEAAAGLQDADPVALLGEAEGGDRASEPRTHDDDVVVVPVLVPGLDGLLLRHVLSSLRTGTGDGCGRRPLGAA